MVQWYWGRSTGIATHTGGVAGGEGGGVGAGEGGGRGL